MAYEEVQDLTRATDVPAAGSPSLFNAALSVKALVVAAEYHVASVLPRRMTDGLVAQALGVSPETLRAAFARVHGESTYRSLLKMRVRLVDLTLRTAPELSPRAVAQVCGFGYFGRFHQLYRRDMGRSPETRVDRASADDAAVQMAREAVAATVERVLKPVAEQSMAILAQQGRAAPPSEARSVEAAAPRREPGS